MSIEYREEIYCHLPRSAARGVGICDPHRSQLGGLLRSSGSETVLAVSGMPLLSHDSVSNMSHGPDSPTTVVVVVFFFVFHFCGLVCQELKRIRLCTSLLCSGIS